MNKAFNYHFRHYTHTPLMSSPEFPAHSLVPDYDGAVKTGKEKNRWWSNLTDRSDTSIPTFCMIFQFTITTLSSHQKLH